MNVKIKVLSDFCPPDVQVTFYLSKMLTEEQEQYLDRIITAWYDIGTHKGYGEGPLHNLHDVIFDDEQTIYLSIDMGRCPISALEVLYKVVIDALDTYGVKVEKIELE